jgi:predicted cupin superfamily sugar epimerase
VSANAAATELAARLGLAPHPEGGFYRETFRDSASTAIYFLLPRGVFSAFHRVDVAELWHHHQGGRIALHVIDEAGTLRTKIVGPLSGDAEPQAIVHANEWQAAELLDGDYALVTCTCAPPFDFKNFEIARRESLSAALPAHRELVARLTR